MDPSRLFHETNSLVLIERIKNHPLGLVVAVDHTGSPKTVHVPVLAETRGEEVFLSFHLTHSNAACKALINSPTCLCVFTGPNAYISPDWYDMPDQVPTWNYVSVECEGSVRALNENELMAQLDGLSAQQEQQLLPKPMWTRSKMKDGKFETMLHAIVGFEMKVDSLQGTTKLNQNKPTEAREKIIANLKGNPIANAMKNLDR